MCDCVCERERVVKADEDLCSDVIIIIIIVIMMMMMMLVLK